MRLLRIIVLPVWIMFLIVSSPAVAGRPMAQLKTDIDNVLDILRSKELKKPKNAQKRRRLISQIIHDRFDFEEMSKRSLSIHWSKRSPEEKVEFISLFGDLLERSYMKRIETYSDEEVIFTDESIDNNYAIVKTKIITKKNVEVPINYHLINKDSKWFIYDVVIEGVSLVNNYRAQFNKIIRSQSYEGLVKRMKIKQEEERALE